MTNRVYILSPIRRVGGSGTEIAHLCDLFLMHSITPHLICGPIGDAIAMDWAANRGCHLMQWPDRWGFLKDEIVIAHGNPNFLLSLPHIKQAKPRQIIYISPMWEPSDTELVAINQGLIDMVVHVSNAQRLHHATIHAAKGINCPYVEGYKPFINLDSTFQDLRYRPKPVGDYFGIGRVQRPYHGKFNVDLWDQMRAIRTPKPKKIFLNSWVDEVAKKTGPIPYDLDVTTFAPYEIEIGEFFQKIHMLVQRSNSGEAFGRYVLEAWACGVPCVLERGHNAFEEMGEPGIDFLIGDSSAHQAELANCLSEYVAHRALLNHHARVRIEKTYGNHGYCWPFWQKILT